MDKVTVIFVHGDILIDKVIDVVTNGPYSHVAIKVPGVGLLESLAAMHYGIIPPCVLISPWRKYDGNPDAKFIDIEVPNLAAGQDEAERLFGRPYGYIDCLGGAERDMTGANPKGDGEWSDDCSEAVTRVLRSCEINVLPDVNADNVTPMALYRELTQRR